MKTIIVREDGAFIFESINSEEPPEIHELNNREFFNCLNMHIETVEPTTLRKVYKELDRRMYESEMFAATFLAIFGERADERIQLDPKPIGGAEKRVYIVEEVSLVSHGSTRGVLDRSVEAVATTDGEPVHLGSSKLECIIDLPLIIDSTAFVEFNQCDTPFEVYSSTTLFDFLNCILNKVAVL